MPEIIRPIEEIFASGFSGVGAKNVGIKQLLDLIDYSLSRGVMIHTIETFMIEGEWEIPTIELGVYGPRPEASNLPWEKQVSVAADDARYVAAQASKLGTPIFNVWLDERA